MHTGSCHCGNIKFQVEGAPRARLPVIVPFAHAKAHFCGLYRAHNLIY